MVQNRKRPGYQLRPDEGCEVLGFILSYSMNRWLHLKIHSFLFRSINRRFHRLESHIVTLAKSIAHLSTEVKTQNSIFHEIDRLGHDLDAVKRQMQSLSSESNGNINKNHESSGYQQQSYRLSPPQSNGQVGDDSPTAARVTTDDNPQKISKLTRWVSVK